MAAADRVSLPALLSHFQRINFNVVYSLNWVYTFLNGSRGPSRLANALLLR